MTADRMTTEARVLSYTHSRRGAPVTNEDIAVGTRMKLGTVGPLVSRMVDRGLLVLGPSKPGRSRPVRTVIHHEYAATKALPPGMSRRRTMKLDQDQLRRFALKAIDKAEHFKSVLNRSRRDAANVIAYEVFSGEVSLDGEESSPVDEVSA